MNGNNLFANYIIQFRYLLSFVELQYVIFYSIRHLMQILNNLELYITYEFKWGLFCNLRLATVILGARLFLWVDATKSLPLWITYIVQSKQVPQHPAVGESEWLPSVELLTYCLQLLWSYKPVSLIFFPNSSFTHPSLLTASLCSSIEVIFLFEVELRLEPGDNTLSIRKVLIRLIGLANDRWLNVGWDSWVGVLSFDVELNLTNDQRIIPQIRISNPY